MWVEEEKSQKIFFSSSLCGRFLPEGLNTFLHWLKRQTGLKTTTLDEELHSRFVSHHSTNSSYYCYCGETENLLIPTSISHQGSEQLQSHLKAIDCGFKSRTRRASFTAKRNNLYRPAVRHEAWTDQVQELSLYVSNGDLNTRHTCMCTCIVKTRPC